MPYIWTETGKTQPANCSFTHDGAQYPRNWLTLVGEADRTAIGISWVDDDRPRKDLKYYRVAGERGNWTVTPRDLPPLKARAISACKRCAGSRLKRTDWYVIRKAETGAEIPADVTEFRTATRAYSNALEAQIEAADFEGLQAIKDEWPLTAEEIADRDRG